MREPSLGTILKALRERDPELTPTALARQMGVSVTQVTRVEEGETVYPRVDLLVKFCEALDVSPNDVLVQAGLVPSLNGASDVVSQHHLVAAALRRIEVAQAELSQASVQLGELLSDRQSGASVLDVIDDDFRPPGFDDSPERQSKVSDIRERFARRERAHLDGSVKDLPAAARTVKPKKKKDDPGT